LLKECVLTEWCTAFFRKTDFSFGGRLVNRLTPGKGEIFFPSASGHLQEVMQADIKTESSAK